MGLSKVEQETIILFDESADTATVDTCNRALIRQLDGLREKRTDITLVREDNYGKSYKIPKRWVKIRAPREISEKEKRQRIDALQKARAAASHGGPDGNEAS